MSDQEMHITFNTDKYAEDFEQWLINGAFATFCSTLNTDDASATLVSNRHSTGITLTGADGPE